MRQLLFDSESVELILKGDKTLDARIGYENIKKIQTDSMIKIIDNKKTSIFNEHYFTAGKIMRFNSLKEAINKDNYKRLIPNAKTLKEAIKHYNSIYPIEKQEELGVYLIEITKVIA